jgi:hypothetical protein
LLPQRSQLGTQDLAHWESFHFLPEMAQSCNTEFSVLGIRIHKWNRQPEYMITALTSISWAAMIKPFFTPLKYQATTA